MSILYRLEDIVRYLPKFIAILRPWSNTHPFPVISIMHTLVVTTASLNMKCDMPFALPGLAAVMYRQTCRTGRAGDRNTLCQQITSLAWQCKQERRDISPNSGMFRNLCPSSTPYARSPVHSNACIIVRRETFRIPPLMPRGRGTIRIPDEGGWQRRRDT